MMDSAAGTRDASPSAIVKPPGPGANNRLINLALFFGSVILTVTVVEVAARVFSDPQPTSRATVVGRDKVRAPFPGVRYLYSARADYTEVWPSNPRGYFDSETNGIRYRINNFGFRGPDFTVERNESLRIAFLGDSFCWGTGVRETDTIARLIERRLNRSRPLGQTYEIYNFCLPGFSSAEEAALYRFVTRYFRPDLLVVWYFLNDVNDPPKLFVYPRRDATGAARRRASADADRRPASRFLELVRAWIDRRRESRLLIEQIDAAYRDEHPGLRSVEAALVRLRRLGEEDGVFRILAVIPWLVRLEGDRYPFLEAHKAVASRAHREGFAVLDLLPAFQGRRASDLWVHPVDHHPNEIGHELMADAMAEFLVHRLEEMDESLLTAAARRRRLQPPQALRDPAAGEWYRPFIALSRAEGRG